MSRPAFFFDRDGVVNRDPAPEPYVLSWDQWSWNPGAKELIAQIARHFVPILVTSQKGVGKGLMTRETLDDIHARLQNELGDSRFAEIYAFTGLPDDLNQPKPDPQMILRAAESHGLDLAKSWLIGDADRDIEMAKRAAIGHTIRVRGLKPIGVEAEFTVDRLQDVPAVVNLD